MDAGDLNIPASSSTVPNCYVANQVYPISENYVRRAIWLVMEHD
uniref:Uncharacterized protein n=1 Tax=Parascaris equorum TaxID=6256 RepID=A0A914R0W6_PAREQ